MKSKSKCLFNWLNNLKPPPVPISIYIDSERLIIEESIDGDKIKAKGISVYITNCIVRPKETYQFIRATKRGWFLQNKWSGKKKIPKKKENKL